MSVFYDSKRLMRAYGQNMEGGDPTLVGGYLKMILEEACEAMVGANPTCKQEIEATFATLRQFAVVDLEKADRVEMYDGAIDVMVVALGFGHSCGFPMERGWNKVFENNMTKVDLKTGYVRRDETGKVLKPEGYKKVDLGSVLKAWEGPTI